MSTARGASSRRSSVAALALVALWIAVYWLWPAGQGARRAPITFDEARLAPQDIPELTPTAQQASQSSPAAPAEPPAAGERPAASTTPAAPANPPANPPRFTEHVVRAGETMQRIALRAYGDASLWEVVAQANPFVDPAKLRAGDRLRLPVDPRNIQGAPAPAQPANASKPEYPLEYTVQTGDSLSEIAADHYGRGSLWRRIFDANRAILDSPDQLKPGMRLLIPAPP